jgi:TonB family protein
MCGSCPRIVVVARISGVTFHHSGLALFWWPPSKLVVIPFDSPLTGALLRAAKMKAVVPLILPLTSLGSWLITSLSSRWQQCGTEARLILRVLPVALSIAVLLNAQAKPEATSGVDATTTIPLAEADQHLLQRQAPVYPPLAKQARIEGTVRLTLQVNANGTVARVVQASGHPLLSPAAIEAARQCSYRPFEIDGIPSNVLVEATVSFSLSPGPPSPRIPFPAIADLSLLVVEYGNGFISLRVSGSGLVEYTGVDDVVVEGKHLTHIRPEEVQELVDAFRRADFFSLRDDYSVGATDVGRTTTSIQVSSLKKAVSDDWVRVPPVLKAVQDAVLKFSHSDQWVRGNADTVRSLLAETPDPGLRREVLSNVLPRAALYGDTAIVREILGHGVDLERRSSWNGTALMHAAERGSPDMVSALLEAGANIHARDKEGRGALIFGAGSGTALVVELLLGAGAKGDEKDKYGDSALMAAAATGNPECVRLLLKHGAQVNGRNKRRQSALLSATAADDGFAIGESGRRRAEIPDEVVHRDTVVRILLDAGADINARGWSGESALFSLEDEAVEELLRHHVNLEARDENGGTALIETVSDSIAELLVKAGANINAENKKGKTALIEAAERNYVDKLNILVKAPGIRLGQRDRSGATALMAAKSAGHRDCVQVLISAGATE